MVERNSLLRKVLYMAELKRIVCWRGRKQPSSVNTSARLCACGCGEKITVESYFAGKRYLYRHRSRTQFKGRKRWEVDLVTGCWNWLGAIGEDGYGIAWSPRTNNSAGAYRVIWEELRGPIPESYVPDHDKCQNKRCVNPDHLRIVDRYINSTQNRKDLKLTFDLAERMRKEYKLADKKWGMQKRLAARYNVSAATVCIVLKGTIWLRKSSL